MLSIIHNLLLLNYDYISLLWLAYPYLFALCIICVCAMIVWRVCYTWVVDNADASAVEQIDDRIGWTRDFINFHWVV